MPLPSYSGKPRIYKQSVYWWYTFEDENTVQRTQNYLYYEGAVKGLEAQLLNMHRRVGAMHLIEMVINPRLLTAREYGFIYKMRVTKCERMTRSQYGWIKGLAERTAV